SDLGQLSLGVIELRHDDPFHAERYTDGVPVVYRFADTRPRGITLHFGVAEFRIPATTCHFLRMLHAFTYDPSASNVVCLPNQLNVTEASGSIAEVRKKSDSASIRWPHCSSPAGAASAAEYACAAPG